MITPYLDIWELLVLPIYILAVIGISRFFAPKQNRNFFNLGLYLRIGGSLFFAFIYLIYYGGGDTLAYYSTSIPFINILFEDSSTGLQLIFSEYTRENYSQFTAQTGYPLGYIYADPQTFMVSRLLIPILLVSFKSYIIGTVVLSSISFIGSWKLFRLFQDIIKDDRVAAFSALFIPSALFWGTGISKDTITYTSAAYFVYGFYYTLVKRQFKVTRIIFSILAIYLILSIKPYIFLVLVPGIILWSLSAPVTRIKNKFLRRSTLPIIGVITGILFILAFSQLSSVLGEYSADQILDKALVTQDDLKRDYYGGNSFDIGEIDPSFIGILSKVPIATFYGLFGPTLLNARNIVMLLSALENTALLLLSLRLLFRVSFANLIRQILDHPIFLFCIVFSLGFAFSIGFTTPNYGALVRFKIPLMPFFVFFLLGMYKANNINNSIGN